MAEVAGLVIGGVGLVALFDTAMSAFDHVDAGKNYGRDYSAAALKVSLIQLRFARWRNTVELLDDTASKDYGKAVASGKTPASDKEVATVRKLLGAIGSRLEEAEERAQRSKQPPQTADQDTGDHSIEALTQQVQKLNLERQKGSSIFTKAKWALHDKKKFDRLIEDLSDFVKDLIDLFPGTEQRMVVYVESDSAELSKLAVEVVLPSGVEGPGDQVALAAARGAAPRALIEAAEEVDPQLKSGLDTVARNATGNTYGDLVITGGEAKVQEGNSVTDDYKGPTGGFDPLTFGKTTVSGKATILRGNNLGGKKGFWDD